MPTTIEYPFQRTPAPGEMMPVAEGVYWIRMPLPFALDHINIWLLEDSAGWTVVDTGVNSEATRELWRCVLAEQVGDRPIMRIMITHHHPDHIGLAGWLPLRPREPIWMSQTEWLYARMLSVDGDDRLTGDMVEFYRRAGCAAPFLAHIRTHGPAYAPLVHPVPSAFYRMHHGAKISIGKRMWQVIVGQGHSPEHACLYAPDLHVLIAGDHVLPRISPNIGIYAWEPDANPLSEYLSSLDWFQALPTDTLVLPSHGMPFCGLHARLRELVSHHHSRLEELRAACFEHHTAMELTDSLFRRPLDPHQTVFAIGETLAHLHLLMAQGEVSRFSSCAGVALYGPVGKEPAGCSDGP